MSDLISRSAIHNKICKHFNIPKDWDGDIAEPLQTVLDLIENEDCAYDVDAVVEQLEKKREETRGLIGKPHMDYGTLCGWNSALFYAIEIVKAGGKI